MTPTTFPRKIDKLIGMRWFILPLVRNLVKNLEGNEGTGHLYVLITLNFIAIDVFNKKESNGEKFLSWFDYSYVIVFNFIN